MKKLIAFDLDGTLVVKRDKKINENIIKIINKLKTQDYIIGIITGRNYQQFQNLEIDFDYDFLSLLNGAYIEVGDTVLANQTFSNDQVEYIFKLIKQGQFSHGISSLEEVLVKENDENVMKAMEIFDLPTPRVVKTFDGIGIYQVMIYEEHHLLHDIKDELNNYDVHQSDQFSFDICNKGITKGKALEQVIKHFEVDPKNTIAFGDGDNDISMIKFANVGVAMGNASDNLKEVADEIVPSVDELGVLEKLKELVR
jgi:Cof subfamily protein (haloacid dehalogenase superfamily)